MILLGCLGVLLLVGLAERLALARARRAVPIRIHVNGSRGKSTVTRLVAAALREAGIPTLAKVTGTEPRLILPDGTERPIRRLAPATIREQAWALRQARSHRARALVAECMAISPALQWTSERDILQSTHTVITNVRLDHTDVMGGTIEQIARSLANTVPRRGVVIAGDGRAVSVLTERCAEEGSRLIVVEGSEIAPEPICLVVAGEVGVDEETARKGMQKAAADPGAATSGTVTVAGRSVEWIDVAAANDPESTDLLVERWRELAGDDSARSGQALRLAGDDRSGQARGVLCVYNHRDDRPARLATFVRWCRTFTSADAVFISGDYPALPLLMRARRRCRGPVEFTPVPKLASALTRVLAARPDITHVVYCGNVRGFVRPVLGH